MASLLGITQSSFDPASRVRFIQFIPALEEAGWTVTHRPNVPDRQWKSGFTGRIARGLHHRAARLLMKWNRFREVRAADEYDAVFVNRDLAGGVSGYLERRLVDRNPRVVFDFDDAIYAGKTEPVARWMCENAAWVTPGNDYLAEFASRYSSRVTVIPTVIDTDRYSVRQWNGKLPSSVRVGWSGSDQSIGTTLFPYLELLRQAQSELDFELVIISNTRPTLPVEGVKWQFIPWSPETEVELGKAFDIGIMPLVDDDFQRGKCGMKLLQYMAAGIPTIASPVGVNRDITRPGQTGFLATDEAEWMDALRALVGSKELRARMGAAGRRRCEDSWSLRRWAPELSRILETVSRMAA